MTVLRYGSKPSAPGSGTGDMLAANNLSELTSPPTARTNLGLGSAAVQPTTALGAKSWKTPVRAATTANITLSGTQTVDGVALIAGDRVLAKDQTAQADNGFYDVAAGAWTRSVDANTSALVPAGTAAFVTEGTSNGGFGFRLTTPDPIVLGTTALTFAPTPVRNIGKAGTDATYEGGVKLGTSAEETISSNVAIATNVNWHNVDSSGGVRTVTLPNAAAIGSIHTIDDSTGSFGTNKCTVQSETATSLRSGATLVSSVDLTTPGGTWTFKKMTSTVWKLLGGVP
jgi:phage-related tail fiber protein